jgi:hypothetical protein
LTTEEWVENRHGEPDAGERAGVSRNQNVLHEVAHDAAAVSEFIGPALARVERDVPGIQLLVLTPDAEVAIAVAAVAARARRSCAMSSGARSREACRPASCSP